MNLPYIKLLLFGFVFYLSSCEPPSKETVDISKPLFSAIHGKDSGIQFQNIVQESQTNNVLNNNYIYSGGGTSVGDINNDGLADIFFVANSSGQHGLYLNQGNFNFKNIISSSGITAAKGWCSGSIMEDFNCDGYLDIYLCRGGEFEHDPNKRKNELYINNGDNTFTESAEKYGIADDNKSTQSTMFDYDNDGDLDLFVVNIPERKRSEGGISIENLAKYRTDPKQYKYFESSSDRLYQNQGNNSFKDVTEEAGLLNYGFGLGVGIFDINKDGWYDIYVTNDFDMDNFLYVNNRGKFEEKSRIYQKHVSYFAMGVDIADINNDEQLDIFEVEMLPESRKRAVVNMESMNRKKFEDIVNKNLRPQYMRNTLHLNRGHGMFSEVAQFSGIAKTDWSWGTVLVDLNDDGLRDIFVTNGIGKDMKDRDQTKVGNKIAKEAGGQLTVEQHSAIFKSTKVQNYAFKNVDGIKFKKTSDEWGFDYKGFSNALCYADFDNDGDLDLVINNLNDTPLVYKNSSVQRGQNNINFKLKGTSKNPSAIGAKVKIFTPEGMQYHEHFTVRGFQSSSEHLVHFGLGNVSSVDSVKIIWPDGNIQRINRSIKANQTKEIKYEEGPEKFVVERVGKDRFLTGASRAYGFGFVHKEISYDDFEKEILLPHKLSQNGPGLAVADINGDKLDDVYIGGAHGFEGGLFISSTDGKYKLKEEAFLVEDKKYEDIDAQFFDADSDGDMDLYVVSGSNEFEAGSTMYQDRLYINDGRGNFKKRNDLIPVITRSGSCVEANDYDNDGDVDLFVGTRLYPGKYPHSDDSYILKNEGGKFINATNKVLGKEGNLGMVTSAVWSDFDKDQDDDLLVVGEWAGIKVFQNTDGIFSDISEQVGLNNTEGWWFEIQKVDIDNDGDEDYICGNIGLNHKFKTSKEKPFQVFCDDFDNSGSSDIVLAFEQDDKLYPVRGRDCSSEQMPFILDSFPTFASFGEADLNDILGNKIEKALHKEVKMFSSVIMLNENGKFTLKDLPVEAQLAPILGVEHFDFDKDGYEDIILVGNMFQTEAETSRADAGFGLVMLNKKGVELEPLRMRKSGFFVPSDSKDIKIARHKNGAPIFIVANNDAPIQTYQLFPSPLQ